MANLNGSNVSFNWNLSLRKLESWGPAFQSTNYYSKLNITQAQAGIITRMIMIRRWSRWLGVRLGHLESWPPGQDWANLYIRVWTWYRHVCTCSHMFMKAQTCTYMSVPWTWIYLNVCSLYIHVHVVIHLYVHGTHTFMNVNICMDTIQTRLYKFTATLLSLHPATSREATKQLQPTPQVCRPPPFPSGRRGLIYGIRCCWRIPWSGWAWPPSWEGPGFVNASTWG